MIRGVVSNLQALVTIQFVIADKCSTSIEFVVDTGFTGYLCIPIAILEELGIDTYGDMSNCILAQRGLLSKRNRKRVGDKMPDSFMRQQYHQSQVYSSGNT